MSFLKKLFKRAFSDAYTDGYDFAKRQYLESEDSYRKRNSDLLDEIKRLVLEKQGMVSKFSESETAKKILELDSSSSAAWEKVFGLEEENRRNMYLMRKSYEKAIADIHEMYAQKLVKLPRRVNK